VAHGSQWMALARMQDTAPGNLTITLMPSGLAVGTYRDTIQFTDNDGETVQVPVSFAIQSCASNPGSCGTPQRPPDSPTSLGQFKIDGTTSLAIGGVRPERTVLLRAPLTDPDAGDSVRLEAETQPIGVPFANTPNAVSPLVARGGVATAEANGLTDY